MKKSLMKKIAKEEEDNQTEDALDASPKNTFTLQ